MVPRLPEPEAGTYGLSWPSSTGKQSLGLEIPGKWVFLVGVFACDEGERAGEGL